MELEEMKNAWNEVSLQMEKQTKLTDSLILQMTTQQYERGLNKVKVPEILGSAVSVGFVLLLLFNLEKFGNGYILICAWITIGILSILPVSSLTSLHQLQNLPLSEMSYKDVLIKYARDKRLFFIFQKLNIYLSGILLFVSPPVSLKLMNSKTTDLDTSTWLWFAAILIPLFAWFAWLVYRYYARIISKLDLILEDLDRYD